MTLYEELLAAQCQIENHESDLYVRTTPEAVSILRKHGAKWSLFVSPVDLELWAEIPFAYEPFWEHRSAQPPA